MLAANKYLRDVHKFEYRLTNSREKIKNVFIEQAPYLNLINKQHRLPIPRPAKRLRAIVPMRDYT